MSKKKESKQTKTIRCAIYIRKSSEEGLELEFNSLDAQREAGESFIASQRAEGWRCLPELYDDGGFSGGNLGRPAIQRLMADTGRRIVAAASLARTRKDRSHSDQWRTQVAEES
jgi:site-specific DNA recombinase